jgi:hypothetical protein
MSPFVAPWPPEVLRLRLDSLAAIDTVTRTTFRSATLRLVHLDTVTKFTNRNITPTQAAAAFRTICDAAQTT